MKKTASNADLKAILDILTDIIRNDKSRWPVRVGFRIVQNVEALTAATSAYLNERSGIINSFSPSGKIAPGDPGYEDCLAQIKELDELETDVEVQPILWDDMKDLEIPLKQLVGLQFFLDEEIV